MTVRRVFGLLFFGGLLASVGLLAACAASLDGVAWEPAGPPGAYTPVLAVAFDPQTPGKALAGTLASPVLYGSADSGITWQPLPAADATMDPWPPPTYALLFHRSSGRALAGTSRGLRISDDGGRTWRPAPETPQIPVYALAEDERGIIFAAGDDPHPYTSRDGGRTWNPLTPLPASSAVLSLAVSTDGAWLLAGTDGGGLFQSYDGGRSWQDAGIGAYHVAGAWIFGAAGSGQEIALARGRGITARSSGRGRAWRTEIESWEGRFDAAVSLPGGRGVLLATDQGLLYRSVAANDWRLWGNGIGRGGAIYALARDPGFPERIIAATETGLYLSADEGLHWEKVLHGPGAPSVNALLAASEDRLLAGSAGGVQASSDLGASWQSVSVGLPPTKVLALAASGTDPARLYAGLDGAGLYYSRDGGHTWHPTAWSGTAVPAILTHPRDADWVLIRVAFERVYLSFDGGMSFAPRWDGMTLQTEVVSLALDPDAPDLVFAGATDALFRSTDGALHWQRVPGALDGQTVFVMVRSPSARSTWLAGTTQGVYRSGDSGLSWVRTGLGAKDVTVTALAIDPSLPTRIYAGTKTDGVFASLDGGRSWVGIGPGSPALNVAALQLSLDGRWLLVATSAGVMKARVR